jgi:hypothetical protein
MENQNNLIYFILFLIIKKVIFLISVSNVRLEYCMLIKGPQGDLFFKNELVYVL